MKKNLLSILIGLMFIFQTFDLFAAKNIETQLTVRTDNGETEDRLAFGTHEDANYWLDEGLGEHDLPPPPPSGLYPVFSFLNQDSSWLITSYKDFQPPVSYSGESRTFSLRVYREAGTQVTFNWQQLDVRIDSAYLVDASTGGLSVKINMKENTGGAGSLYLDRYLIIVWYNYTNTSVEEKIDEDDDLTVYPNPVSDYAEVIFPETNYEFVVTDLLGNTVMKSRCRGLRTYLSTAGLSEGIYIINAFKNGYYIKTKFMKY